MSEIQWQKCVNCQEDLLFFKDTMSICNHVILQTRKPVKNNEGDLVCLSCEKGLNETFDSAEKYCEFFESHVKVLCKECWGC
jgi:hypothetical protein